MWAIVNVITVAFTTLFKYGDTFSRFIQNSGLLSKARFGFRIGMYTILIVSFVSYATLLVTFIYYIGSSVVTVYNFVSTFLTSIQTMQYGSGSSSPILQPLFLLLNTSGLVAGFNAAFPFMASAVLFRLLKPMTEYTLKAQAKLIEFLQRFINGMTAS